MLGAAATATSALLVTGDAAIVATIGVGMLAVVPWTVGRRRRRHAELSAACWDRVEHLEREADAARGREGARLAAEMHDLVGHDLAQATLRVGALEVAPTRAAEHRAARAARESVDGRRRAARRRGAVAAGADVAAPAEDSADLVDRVRVGGLAVELTMTGTAPGRPSHRAPCIWWSPRR